MTTTATKSNKVADLTAHRTEVDELLAQRAAAKAAAKAQLAIVDLAEKRLRTLLGDADEAQIEGRTRYVLSHCTNTGIDRHKLLEIAPAAYAACFRSTPYTKLNAK